MHGRIGFSREDKIKKNSKNYKGQKILECHDRQPLEEEENWICY